MKKRIGRPCLDGKAPLKQLSIRIPEWVYEEFCRESAMLGYPPGRRIRQVLLAHVRSLKQVGHQPATE